MPRSSGNSIAPAELKAILDELADRYNNPGFIESDPVAIPHRFSAKEDIEIAAFLTATIAWGNRKSILSSASRMMSQMGESPFDFVMEAAPAALRRLEGNVHRTFQADDLVFLIRAWRQIYKSHGGMEEVFTRGFQAHGEAGGAIHFVRRHVLAVRHDKRSEKHFADPLAGSSAKRINMFLRWMVRRDGRGVDFGLWKDIPMAQLSVPLDVHSGNTARKFGLLTRTANDWKAVCELDASLRKFNPQDPVRYDYALFGLGVDPDLRNV